MDGLDFYYLRTPLISLENLLTLLHNGELANFIKQPQVDEAIFLASPTLYWEIKSDPYLKNPKLKQTVLKYVLRMASRSTPFGLFAGCSVGEVGPLTQLDISDRKIKCHYWLNSTVFEEILQNLNKNSTIRTNIRYYNNSSLYQVNNQLRYLESNGNVTKPLFYTSQIKTNPIIRLVLRKAKKGATINELTQVVINKGYHKTDAIKYIEQLIEDQVLISDLSINVTGKDYLVELITVLKKIPEARFFLPVIQELIDCLAKEEPVWQKHSSLQSFFQLNFNQSFQGVSILQGDSLYSESRHFLSHSIIQSLQETFKKLLALKSFHPPSESILQFKRSFYTRYEEREVPLALAIDANFGIGYGSNPLIGDVSIIQDLLDVDTSAEIVDEKLSLPTQIQKWLFQVYNNWVGQSKPVIELTDLDLANLPKSADAWPDNFYIFGFFLAASSKAIDTGYYKFKGKLVAGPSPFPLLGRFCRADQELFQKMKSVFEVLQEQDTHRVHAEIVHLASIPAGNVLKRPHLSEYEIPYLGKSTLPLNKQIFLDDLWVSVPKGERIVLRSKRLGKEVLPRLTTAHNYQYGLPIYHFLCDLQYQETSLSLMWEWGFMNTFRYLPRVQYRKVILTEARWRVYWEDFTIDQSCSENIKVWRVQWKWPRFIALVQDDQELFLDLDHLECQELLISTLQRLKTLQLIEWLRTPENCCIDGPDGKLAHEIIIPFFSKKNTYQPTLFNANSNLIQRTFFPVTEWFYLKVYSGPLTSNDVLLKLGKLARSCLRSGQITHWFFIRFEDPDPHIRIRFHLTSTNHKLDLLSECRKQLQTFVNSGEVHRIQLDTYQREIERYGEQRILATEQLFWADSDAILSIRQSENIEKNQLLVALFGIDNYLTDFGLSLEEKIQFCLLNYETLLSGKKINSNFPKKLAKLFRQNQVQISAILFGSGPTLLANLTLNYIVRKRSKRSKDYINSLQFKPKELGPYLSSLIHMSINRLFDEHHNMYELLIYHHLFKIYKARSYHF